MHALRKRELDFIFGRVPQKSFAKALEIGAGDGFQSEVLSNYARNLICTEYNRKRLKKINTKNITYNYCDAEYIDREFEPKTFDLLFSSNLLEHVRNRNKVLTNAYNLLSDEGVLISVVPNVFLKFCWIGLFYPNRAAELLEVIAQKGGTTKILNKIANAVFMNKGYGGTCGSENNSNNLKGKNLPGWKKIVLPAVHGDYGSHLEELLAYRKKAWIRLIEYHGFKVSKVLKMPVASGYGFGLQRIRYTLEKMGVSSSLAFIAFKTGYASRFQAYWSE